MSISNKNKLIALTAAAVLPLGVAGYASNKHEEQQKAAIEKKAANVAHNLGAKVINIAAKDSSVSVIVPDIPALKTGPRLVISRPGRYEVEANFKPGTKAGNLNPEDITRVDFEYIKGAKTYSFVADSESLVPGGWDLQERYDITDGNTSKSSNNDNEVADYTYNTKISQQQGDYKPMTDEALAQISNTAAFILDGISNGAQPDIG